MRSHRSATIVMVTLLGALVACSRGTTSGGSNEPNRWSFKPAKNEANWQVKCDALCDVKAKAPTLEALCTQVAAAAKPTIGSSKCEARKSIGYPAIPASAVSDAAIVELTPAIGAHHAFLAVKGASGWQLGRSLGAATSFKTLEASPVDLPGIEPAGVQLRVALSDTAGTSERLVVCGLTGDGVPLCPLAVEIAGTKSTFAQMGAGIAGAMNGSEWRAEVALTPKGFVAKPVTGTLPDGLAGEHSFELR